MRTPRWRTRAVAAVALAVLLRLGYGLLRPPQPPGESLADPDGYVGVASSVADSWSLADKQGRPSAIREPLYPLLLGLSFKLFGKRYAALLILNVFFGIPTLLLMYRLGQRLFNGRVALTALALAAVYPPFIYYAAQPLRESLMGFMGLAAVLSLMEARLRRTAQAAAGAGVVNALAGLTNSTFLPFGLILGPLGLAFPKPSRSGLARAALYAGVLAAVYAPWPLRNHLVFGRWIVGSTAGAAGTFYTYLIVPQQEGGTPAQEKRIQEDPVVQAGAGLDPIAAEQYYWKEGLRWVAERPIRYARLVVWRLFWDMWRPVPRPRVYAHSYAKIRLASLLTDGWILPVGFLGMLLFRFSRGEAAWAYLFLFSMAFAYSLIFTMIRYRFSLMPWFLLFSAYALHRAWDRKVSLRSGAAAIDNVDGNW